LLADRFSLAAHTETREQSAFALVLAKNDGKRGPQLLKSDFDCAAYAASPHEPPEPGRTPPCATRINRDLLSGRAIPMTQLATSLTPFVNRFVFDKTGLAGRFDVELKWTPDLVSADAVSEDSRGPSIFTALQEQLGLKLAPEKGPVDLLVVDRAAEPSPN
jgi:uncharacterized protein (TIGR03435 family)